MSNRVAGLNRNLLSLQVETTKGKKEVYQCLSIDFDIRWAESAATERYEVLGGVDMPFYGVQITFGK